MFRAALFIFIILLATQVQAQSTKVALLDFKVDKAIKALSSSELAYLMDLFKSTMASRHSEEVVLVTKENITTLLPPDTTLEDCVGECVVETGRTLGVDYIVTGYFRRLFKSVRLFVTAVESKTGKVVSLVNIPIYDMDRIDRDVISASSITGCYIMIREAACTKNPTLSKKHRPKTSKSVSSIKKELTNSVTNDRMSRFLYNRIWFTTSTFLVVSTVTSMIMMIHYIQKGNEKIGDWEARCNCVSKQSPLEVNDSKGKKALYFFVGGIGLNVAFNFIMNSYSNEMYGKSKGLANVSIAPEGIHFSFNF